MCRVSRMGIVAAMLALVGCGGGEQPAPGALTRDEKQALEDAASMLDAANNEQTLPSGPILQETQAPTVRPLPRSRAMAE